MRTKLVKRHYCDHCNKGGMVAASMREHERTCLRNTARGCFLCETNAVDMTTLVAAINTGGLPALREACDDCPACTLAAILQSMPENPDEEDYVQYDYKAEKRNRRDMDQIRTWRATNSCSWVPGCMFLLIEDGLIFWKCKPMEIGG